MTQTIRTHWHTLRELVKAKQVYFTCPPKIAGSNDEPLAARVDQFGASFKTLDNQLDLIEKVPLFVIDPELMAIANDREYRHSLLDMQKADVLRLPFPAMLIEFTKNNKTEIVFLRDLQATDTGDFEFEEPGMAVTKGLTGTQFYGSAFRIEQDDEGKYAVLSPCVMDMTVQEKDGEPWLRFGGSPQAWCQQENALAIYGERTSKKDAGSMFAALCAAALILQTQGVAREVVEVSKLNKRRVSSNKPAIPRHTYISIGRVYKTYESNDSESYVARRSPRPHWRRGHSRRIIEAGTKGVGRKWKYFPPKLVAYYGDHQQIQVEPQTYKVTK